MKYHTKLKDITFGTDPEWFAGKTEADGKVWVVPAPFFMLRLGLEHTEDKKHPVCFENEQVKLHQDGAAFEGTFKAFPGGNWRGMLTSVYSAEDILSCILARFPDHTDGIAILPTIDYDWAKWLEMGEDIAAANEFGCDRDWNAFDEFEKAVVIDATKWPERYGGGHVHTSGHPLMAENPKLCIRILAATVGATATLMSPVPELEKRRTFLYGKSGKFRPQKYPDGSIGIEYRTPSNTWTDPMNFSMAEAIFHSYEVAVERYMNNPGEAEAMLENMSSYINEAIVNADQALASDILAYVMGDK